jgi:hypothetical protein
LTSAERLHACIDLLSYLLTMGDIFNCGKYLAAASG